MHLHQTFRRLGPAWRNHEMHARTELLLIEMLWGLDLLTSSPMRMWTETFEAWAQRNGLAKRIAQLEAQGIVETGRSPNLDRILRLTESGRIAALGGRDPIEWWNRVWAGVWQLLVYDVPVAQNALRLALQRRLKLLHFGRIQGSAWISASPLCSLAELLRGTEADPRSFFTMIGPPGTGESEAEIVARAWDFEAINSAYDRYLDFIRPANRPAHLLQDRSWRERENALWLGAVTPDPLLPRVLWPKGYKGEQAFYHRAGLLALT